MNWPRVISVAAHCALIGWLYYLSTLPAPPLVPDTILLAEIVQPIYKPPPPPAPPPVIEPPKQAPQEPPKPRRARVRPRAAPPPPEAPEPVAALPIPPAPPTPPDAPLEPTETFIRDPQPVFRPHPEYPERALRFRREGVVELEFTIAIDGTVHDIRVLRSEPEGVFDRAATKALAKWRYAPQLVNAVPSERRGVRVRIVFKLDQT
ncbi:MAG: energy transducer TonB [Myxococcota bacterium]